MNAYFHMIKRWDAIIIIALVLLSFLPLAIFSYQQTKVDQTNANLVAVITVDNEEIERITLTGNTESHTFDITASDGDTNTIEIKNNQIRIKAATCPDQVCVRTGFIAKAGETIVCLPHKLVIEIQTESGETDDIIISS
ncbi:NusG domain II-containing protein [Aquibacillus koreensis]|uniref:NusG domain II-containing protein n=1 Tax=Aquibacillus koreensis TaxID=279446 RepID=A0A9X4AJL5_9BACI|nr:NusG domain II-containing protein [Aquibacillus koreensis]MCT2534300.1 NusG domain II-containing protein [Aquibacillus koreensis]MDC3422377.1 NusG domain II-containing protein [Aquibacillus koreensis]